MTNEQYWDYYLKHKFKVFMDDMDFGYVNFNQLNFLKNKKISQLLELMYVEAFKQFNKEKKNIKDGYVIDFIIDYSAIKDVEFFHEDTKHLKISLKFKDKIEKPIDVKDHFYVSMEIKDDLCVLHANEFSYYPKETTIDKWQFDFMFIAYSWLNYIFKAFDFYKKYGITDNGYVEDKELAKRIIKISASLYYKGNYTEKYKAFIKRLENDDLQMGEYGEWWFGGDKGNLIIGMNGIFIQTVEGYLKEGSSDFNKSIEDLDYNDFTDEEIQDFMDMGNLITLPVKDRLMTFILSEGD